MIKHKWLLPTLLLVVSLPFAFANKTSNIKVLSESEIEEVVIGDSIKVEPRTLVHDGESKVVQGQIIFPDGSSRSGKSFTITMSGKYQVVYSAFFGTTEVSESIYYNCYPTSGDFFLSSNENNRPVAGEYSFNNSFKGAKLKLDANTIFTYDGVIDFNTFNPNTPFFEYIIDTQKQGESDLESFSLKLTDVDDPTIYVEYSITDSGPINDDGEGCYILAGANGQYKTGYEYGVGSKFWISNFGANVGSSFRALPKNSPHNTAKFYFDYAKKELYVAPTIRTTSKNLITDLDSKDIYGASLWSGFTNGKAYLSVRSTSLISNSATMIVTRVGDVDLSSLKFEDKTAPVININYEEQSPLYIPNASVGVPYKIFDADIVDNFDKNLSYSTFVTYQDTVNSKTKDVSIINGSFIPQKAGNYSIKYVAKDHSNNVATKIISVVAVNDSQTMTISLDQDSITQTVYSEFNLPSINDVHVSGGSGKAKVTRRIIDSNRKEIIIEGDTFIPEETGTYNVYYVANDYIGNTATCTLTLNVTATTKPLFIGDIFLPRVLIKNHTYNLPSYQGVETVDNKSVYLDSSIYVNGEKNSDNKFVAGDECHISYHLDGKTGSNTFDKDIDVVDSHDSTDQTAYFYGNEIEVVENRDEVTLSTNTDGSTLFASILAYDNLYIKFRKNNSFSNFDKLVFKFSDSQNPDISLTFKVKFATSGATIQVGSNPDSYDFTTDGKDAYSIDFNNVSRILSDINYKEILEVKKDDNGNPFTGFKHGLYLDISFEGVSSTSKFDILSISNQDFGHSDVYADFSSPIIIMAKRFVNEQQYNADAYVPAVEVFDVLSDARVTVSAKKEKDFKLRNADATKDNTFKLDSFGRYDITYQATDTAGQATSFPRKITVFDYIAPILNVNYNLSEKYSLNSAITIPSYSISDNLSDYTVNVYLIMPDDQQRLLIKDVNGEVTSFLDSDSLIYNRSFRVNKNTFKAEQYGRYILRYVAYDQDFNKVTKDFVFNVA